MAGRIVLLGATGYIGGLTAAALVEAKERPLLAARSPQNLAAAGAKVGHGLDTAVVDLDQPDSLLEVLRPGDVVVNTAGPFRAHGRSVVESVIQRRGTYIDCAIEPEFLADVFESLGPTAAQAGVALVPAFGHQYVAGNLAACLALDGLMDRATSVEIGYFRIGPWQGTFSAGDRASRADASMAMHWTWRGGQLVATRYGERMRTFPVGAVDLAGLSVGGSEHMAIPRLYPGVGDVGVYVGEASSPRAARRARRWVRRARRLPAVPALVRRWGARPASVEGPAAELLAQMGATVIAEAYDSDGSRLRQVTLVGSNPYTFTAATLAWAALRAAGGFLSGEGALGPVEAFGLAGIREACAGLVAVYATTPDPVSGASGLRAS